MSNFMFFVVWTVAIFGFGYIQGRKRSIKKDSDL